MGSIREQVVTAAIATLSGAEVTGDPPKPAGLNVHRERNRPIEKDTMPAILVYLKEEESEPIGQQRRAPLTEEVLSLMLESRASGSGSASPDQALDPVLVWAVYRLLKNESLGGLANGIDKVRTSWNSKEGDVTLASATTHFRIRYRTSRIDPRSRG
jgi:hypothetical protein